MTIAGFSWEHWPMVSDAPKTDRRKGKRFARRGGESSPWSFEKMTARVKLDKERAVAMAGEEKRRFWLELDY